MMHGIALYCMVLIGIAWHSIVLHGIAWYYMVLNGIAWYFTILHGIAWYCMVLHGIAKKIPNEKIVLEIITTGPQELFLKNIAKDTLYK